MHLKIPLIIASGTGGMGEYLKLIDSEYIGAYTLKTITFFPKKGNPPPRLFATENYLINSIGLENVGLEKFLQQLSSGEFEELFAKTKVIASFSGDDVDQMLQIAKKIKPFEKKFIAIEFNLSCPNVSKGGLGLLSDIHGLENLLLSIRRELNGFLIAKIGIEGVFVEAAAEILKRCGWQGLSLINTIRSLYIIGEKIIKGGLSGPVLKPVALRAVYEVKNRVSDLYVIGGGGIMNEEDADDFIKAGADAVSIGTAIFKDPKIVSKIAKHILRRELK